MSDSDLFRLYSERILALAADMPKTAPLPHVTNSATRRAPLCGSTITVDLLVEKGVVTDYAQDIRACALGQASAAIFGAMVVGRTKEQIVILRDQLRAMLKGGPVPDAPFGEYEVLTAAREYPNRHGSIMLAPEATITALDAADLPST
ncbi:iron-sulfur cluster assembly scaffold protein [Rhodobacteraceae bacterium]|nr:iron-sulfur cluster assembly scaffold protein [Paracoccaceae bacterium]